MPIYPTTEPISVSIQLGSGLVQIEASDRTDTVVEVSPADPLSESDTKAAAETEVDFTDGRLRVTAPRHRGQGWGWGWFTDLGSIDIRIGLPAGSRVEAIGEMARFRCSGTLAACSLKTGAGDIDVGESAALYHLNTAFGDITVGRGSGHAEATTGSGRIAIREIDGTAELKSGNGEISVGQVTGDLKARSGNGSITVDRALAGVTAKTACGSVRISEVTRGSVVIETAAGELEVGIREGSAAWLDVSSLSGRVRNSLAAADDPGPAGETVEVKARTAFGDIVIRRA